MKRKTRQKKLYNYIVIFDPAEEGGFNVSFPAFPGCVTFGKTYEEAKAMASEVLELWLEELQSRKEKIPVSKSRPLVDEVQVPVRVR